MLISFVGYIKHCVRITRAFPFTTDSVSGNVSGSVRFKRGNEVEEVPLA